MSKIMIKGLCKAYPLAPSVLNNISFEINNEDFLVIVGESGIGKTTLLRLLAGLDKPDNGQIIIDSIDQNNIKISKRNVSMVFQEYYLYPSYTIYQNIAMSLKNEKLSRDLIDEKIMKIAKILSIENLLSEKPRNLSDGQRQRAAIARALVKKSEYILFDEPLSGLDEKMREDLKIFLLEMKKTMDIPFIYVTHNKMEALGLASKIMILKNGRINSIASPNDIYNNPDNLYQFEYFATYGINKWEGTIVDETHVEVLDQIIEVPFMDDFKKGKRIILAANPEEMYFSKEGIVCNIKSRADTYDSFIYETVDHKKIISKEEPLNYMLSNKFFVFSKKSEQRISGIINQKFIPCQYNWTDEYLELSFLNIKHQLDKDYMGFILNDHTSGYLKLSSDNFNKNNIGIKLEGTVLKVVGKYIYVSFFDTCFYFKESGYNVNDKYEIYLDIDSLELYDESFDLISICNYIDPDNIWIENIEISDDKNFGTRIYPLYEENLGKKNIAFFKANKNVYMTYTKEHNSIFKYKKAFIKNLD